MKILRWIGRSVAAIVLGLVVKWLWSHFDSLPVFYSAYPIEIWLGIFAVILLITGLCFLDIALHRRIKLKEAFDVCKLVKNLTHDDFHIAEYNECYIERESDKEIENLMNERKTVFITGIPMIGKTRMAYEATKKLKGFYLLKPKYREIDIQKIKLPFFKKRIVLFLDDLNKYVGKFYLDGLVRKLKRESKYLVVIATCRRGKEYDKVFAEKEMQTLLTECQKGKTEPRLLNPDEESKLASAVGKSLEEIASDGTPGSITIDLNQMTKLYKELGDERSILKSLKLLREGNIFLWKADLVKKVSKGIFDLNIERTRWDGYLNALLRDGFISRSGERIFISHDVYLGDRVLYDYDIGDADLVSLKDMLFQSYDSTGLFNLGHAFSHRNNLQQAEDSYRKSIEINPDFAYAHNNLGILLSELKRYEEAEKEYKEALRINSNDAFAHYNLGNLLCGLKRNEEAEKEYKEALRINPDDADAHNNLGILLSELKRYEEAEKEYKEALRINRDYTYAHNNLGNLFRELKRYDEAEKEYREVLRINPNDTDAHYNLGVLLSDLKRYKEAKKEYRKALRINPDDADAHYMLERLLGELKRYEEAVKEWKGVLQIDPNSAEAHNNLGLLFEKLGRYEETEKEYKEALRIKPDDADAHHMLGGLFYYLKRYEEAEKEWKEALRIKPDFAEDHLNLGRLLMHMDRKEEARKELMIARDLSRRQGKEQSAKIAEEYLGEL